jgi:hypothetical protein
MSFNKAELKKQLEELGIKTHGNYVKKSDIKKICADPNWLPNKKQKEFANALEAAFKANKNMTKEDVLKIAKEVKIDWNQLANMSDHEGYYRDRLPMHFIRQIRNTTNKV